MILPDNPGDLFPTEYAQFLADYILDHFEEIQDMKELKLLKHTKLNNFRLELFPDLLNRYIHEGLMNSKDELGLVKMMASPDHENWLVVLTVLRRYKRKRDVLD